MVDELNLSSDAIVESGLRAVLEVEGTFQAPVKQANTKFGGEQLTLRLADAVILKMMEGAEQPELKDNVFTQWLKFSSKPGAIAPIKGTFLAKHFIPDAEKLYAKLNNAPIVPGTLMKLVGQRVRWVRLEEDYTIENKETGEVKKGKTAHYTFALDVMTAENINEHVKKLVLGKTLPAAKRALVMDAVAKTHPEFKQALDDGTLAEKLGLTIVDEKFTEKEKEIAG